MKAKALICDAAQKFALKEVELATPGDRDLVVRALCTGVSQGTELALIRNKISWGPYPILTGYQGVGIVEQAGKDSGYREGDRVIYRCNHGGIRLDGQAVTPTQGVHASHAVTPVDGNHGAMRVPEGASDEAASMFVMPSVGLHGVDMAGAAVGETAAVCGCGLIGLGVVAACVARGCRVVAVDVDAKRLEAAAWMGAEVCLNPGQQNLVEEMHRVKPGGADLVFESTGIPALLNQAIALCRGRGKFVFQGNYGGADIAFPFMAAHVRQLTAFFPCDDGYQPCRHTVLRAMANQSLPWDRLVTHRIKPKDAAAFYGELNAGRVQSLLGAIIDWR